MYRIRNEKDVFMDKNEYLFAVDGFHFGFFTTLIGSAENHAADPAARSDLYIFAGHGFRCDIFQIDLISFDASVYRKDADIPFS